MKHVHVGGGACQTREISLPNLSLKNGGEEGRSSRRRQNDALGGKHSEVRRTGNVGRSAGAP